MRTRGVRGATTAHANDAASISDATQELLRGMVEANHVSLEEVVSVLFTATDDLDAAFPAAAARALGPGWADVSLIDAAQMHVKGALPLCIRALMTIGTDTAQHGIRHIYLRGARALRPDIAQGEDTND